MDALNELFTYYENLKANYSQEDLVTLLRDIQEIYSCISAETQAAIAEEFHIGLPVIRTIIRQYPSLKEAAARHRITVCTGHQCSRNGCRKLIEQLEKETGASIGETTKDGRFMIQTQCCLKHCGTAPNLRIDQDLYQNIAPRDIPRLLKKYQ